MGSGTGESGDTNPTRYTACWASAATDPARSRPAAARRPTIDFTTMRLQKAVDRIGKGSRVAVARLSSFGLPNVAYQPRCVLRAGGCLRLLAKQAIVVGMAADPEPYESVGRLYREGAIVSPDPSRPEAADLLEVMGRMTWVSFQARVGLIGKLLDLRWQGSITRPEIGRRVVSQRGLVLPAAWSRRAFSASWSSLPA